MFDSFVESAFGGATVVVVVAVPPVVVGPDVEPVVPVVPVVVVVVEAAVVDEGRWLLPGAGFPLPVVVVPPLDAVDLAPPVGALALGPPLGSVAFGPPEAWLPAFETELGLDGCDFWVGAFGAGPRSAERP